MFSFIKVAVVMVSCHSIEQRLRQKSNWFLSVLHYLGQFPFYKTEWDLQLGSRICGLDKMAWWFRELTAHTEDPGSIPAPWLTTAWNSRSRGPNAFSTQLALGFCVLFSTFFFSASVHTWRSKTTYRCQHSILWGLWIKFGSQGLFLLKHLPGPQVVVLPGLKQANPLPQK